MDYFEQLFRPFYFQMDELQNCLPNYVLRLDILYETSEDIILTCLHAVMKMAFLQSFTLMILKVPNVCYHNPLLIINHS